MYVIIYLLTCFLLRDDHWGVSLISAHLVRRDTECFCSGHLLKEVYTAKKYWKTETVSLWRTKERHAYAHYKRSDSLCSGSLSYNTTHWKYHMQELSSCRNWGSGNQWKNVDSLATAFALKNQVLCLWLWRIMSSASIHDKLWQINLLASRKGKIDSSLFLIFLKFKYRVLSGQCVLWTFPFSKILILFLSS